MPKRFPRACAMFMVCVASACGGKDSRGFTITTPLPVTNPLLSLTGQVTQSGTTTAVPGATVLIADGVNGGRTSTTDVVGNYIFRNVTPSTFTLNASVSGFASQNKAVSLTSNQTVPFALVRTGPRTEFGKGQWLVNGDIAAGRCYSATSFGCYWERQSVSAAVCPDIIAYGAIGVHLGPDHRRHSGQRPRAFKTNPGCGTWFNTPTSWSADDHHPRFVARGVTNPQGPTDRRRSRNATGSACATLRANPTASSQMTMSGAAAR